MKQAIRLLTLAAAGAAAALAQVSFQTVNCAQISGTQSIQNNATVEIFDGPTLIATQETGPTAFNIPTPPQIKDNQPHSISAGVMTGYGMEMTPAPVSLTCPQDAPGYQYDYTDVFSSLSSSWTVNGATPTTGANGLSNSSGTGSGLVYNGTIPGVANAYEVRATLQLTVSGGAYSTYLRASSNAMEAHNQGTFYDVELWQPTFSGSTCTAWLNVYQVISGTGTQLASASVPCHNGMTLRSIINGSGQLWAYIDNTRYISISTGSTIASGQPGIGIFDTPAGNSIVEAQLGHLDTVAPAAPGLASLAVSKAPNRVDLQWPGTADDANGTGIAMYEIYRNGTAMMNVAYPEYEDKTVAANTTYQYQITAYDYHGNGTASSTFSVTTPPTGSIDPLRVGIAAQGTYWGGAGENIDTRSGNLNYSVPLLKPIGRNGLSVPVNLVYNSQFWRQDSGTTWLLGRDVGYGLGWELLAGSLTPYYNSYEWAAPAYYLFEDSSGAEYRLDQVSSGVYSSLQGIYVWYDSNAKRLYFKDGTFWTFGCVSSGTEQDAGTLYPTAIQDQLGNYIAFTYAPGAGVSWPNSSARISAIQDARVPGGATYSFNYLTQFGYVSIQNMVGASDSYNVFLQAGSALVSAFDGVTHVLPAYNQLGSVAQTSTGLTTSFAYYTSGELQQVNLPNGGYLQWAYTTGQYSGNRNIREVQNRYLEMAAGGTTTFTYAITHPGETPGTLTSHAETVLTDNGGSAAKFWYFNPSGTYVGLPSAYEEGPSGSSAGLSHISYVWSKNATSNNPYISSTTAYVNYGQSNAISKTTTQTLDRYGNVTQMVVSDWSGGSAPSRTYTNTWLHGADGGGLVNPQLYYDQHYFRNRLSSSSLTDGTSSVTLATNSYDSGTCCAKNYGLLTNAVTPQGTGTYAYDSYGNATTSTMNGLSTSVTMDATNTVPAAVTTGSTSASLQWNSFLGLTQSTGQNGDMAQISYDTTGRPSTTTSPYGAVTNYAYVNYSSSASPSTITATTGNSGTNHWVKKTLDGFGRVVKEVTGDSTNGATSEVDTQYAPCGCSPDGKLSAVSQPYTPGGTPIWTRYTYDWQGRTTSVTLPDTSVTNYVYDDRVVGTDPAASFVRVIDPKPDQKRFQMDGFGHLAAVTEDPTGVAYLTTYAYDLLDHLVQVTQARTIAGTLHTQNRTFNYSSNNNVTGYLQSANNPENGTVTYAYNSDWTLASKTDNRGVVTGYQYDSQKRLTAVGTGTGTSFLPVYTYTWDTATGSSNALGRIAQISYPVASASAPSYVSSAVTETYSYTAPGSVASKTMGVNHSCSPCYVGTTSPVQIPLTLSYAYDSEGRRTQMTYPVSISVDNPSNPAPKNETLVYGYDLQERPTTLTDTTSSTALVTGTSYYPSNQVQQITYMQNFIETRVYNNLLQLTQQSVTQGGSVMSLQYGYITGHDDGRIQTRTDGVSGEQVTYTYDTLKQLTAAVTTANPNVPQWSGTFSYDGFGNLTSKTGSIPNMSMIVDPASNRVTSAGGSAYQYDNNGNMVSGPTTGTNTLVYDFQNRLVSGFAVSTPSAWDYYYYAYDASNRRVWKGVYAGATLSSETYYLYDIDGKQVGSYALTSTITSPPAQALTLAAVSNHIYFAGKHIADRTCTPGCAGGSYAMTLPDRLASEESDYPYGEEKGTVTANERIKFASYWRDNESGLDYALNRYYSSSMGRFLSPDPSHRSSLTSPLSWNQYVYAADDPVNRNDPRGLCPEVIAGITMGPGSSQAFDDIAALLGAVASYPYNGETHGDSVMSVISQAWFGPNESTSIALSGLLSALNGTTGQIDVIAYSGGAQAFATAYGQLSSVQQARIGSVLYISPGTGGSTLPKGTAGTFVVLGAGTTDIVATFGTVIPTGVPITKTGCSHTDLACLLAAAQTQISLIERNGVCSSQDAFVLPPNMNAISLTGYWGSLDYDIPVAEGDSPDPYQITYGGDIDAPPTDVIYP